MELLCQGEDSRLGLGHVRRSHRRLQEKLEFAENPDWGLLFLSTIFRDSQRSQAGTHPDAARLESNIRTLDERRTFGAAAPENP